MDNIDYLADIAKLNGKLEHVNILLIQFEAEKAMILKEFVRLQALKEQV